MTLLVFLVVGLVIAAFEMATRKRRQRRTRVTTEARRLLGDAASFDFERGLVLDVPTEGVRLVAEGKSIEGAPAEVIAAVRERVAIELMPARRIFVDDRQVRVEQASWRVDDVLPALAEARQIAEAIATVAQPVAGHPYRPHLDAEAMNRRADEVLRYDRWRSFHGLFDIGFAVVIGGMLLLMIVRLFF